MQHQELGDAFQAISGYGLAGRPIEHLLPRASTDMDRLLRLAEMIGNYLAYAPKEQFQNHIGMQLEERFNTLTEQLEKYFRHQDFPKSCLGAATKIDLDTLEKRIMAKQAEVAALLTQTADRVTKIGNETRTLLKKIEDLQTAIGNLENVTPELEAAANALAAQVAVVDDLVPDDSVPAPAPTPAP